MHVPDEGSLDIVMGELDTITDFTDYLQKKEDFIRAGRPSKAEDEENLVAYYAARINDEGDRDHRRSDVFRTTKRGAGRLGGCKHSGLHSGSRSA